MTWGCDDIWHMACTNNVPSESESVIATHAPGHLEEAEMLGVQQSCADKYTGDACSDSQEKENVDLPAQPQLDRRALQAPSSGETMNGR